MAEAQNVSSTSMTEASPAQAVGARASSKVSQAALAAKGKALAEKHKVHFDLILGFFREAPYTKKQVLENEEAELKRFHKLEKRVRIQAYIMLGLVALHIILAPLLKPFINYIARRPDNEMIQLVPLSAPNLTDDAILSWSATSITEILTFGFGDFDQRILSQRPLFTDQGWESFTKAIRDQDMRTNFKQRQLVLTSVPANSPVIVGKGPDEEGVYKWLVEMPIVMTYTTNNNVTTRQKGIVRLVIVRIDTQQNAAGLGIKEWQLL